MRVRTRIAPSPTGPLHIGTARTALFNFLFTKQKGGKFILRIEDTDIERSDEKYVADIVRNLKWLGIEWDEGPTGVMTKDEKGAFGPYRQSERIFLYKKYLEKLLKEGKAYYCFCTPKELEKEREEQMKKGELVHYSGKCRKLTKEQVEKLKRQGRRSIIRFKTEEKKISFNDLIRGKIDFESNLIGDFAIAKDLETPLYNFAVAVDDFTMKISYVIRGEDHISNTPKQILIQKALGFPTPLYAHIPLILNPDHTKVSKRDSKKGIFTDIHEYKKRGYLPEAMVNFMALLGWNPKSDQEFFSIEELIKEFDFKKINLSGAIFNKEKLDFINAHYLRNLPLDELTHKTIPFLIQAGFIKERGNKWQDQDGQEIDFDYLRKIMNIEKERIKVLSEIMDLVDYFFVKVPKYETKLLFWKKQKKKELADILERLEKFFSRLSEHRFKKERVEELLREEIKLRKFGVGETLWPLRVLLSGRKASPSPFELVEILGKERVLKRIKVARKKLENEK